MFRVTRSCLAVALWVIPACFALPTAMAAALPPLSDDQIRDVVVSVGELYIANYHDPVRGQEIADTVRAAMDAGEFDGIGERDRLAAVLSQRLAAFDRHGLVEWSDGEAEGGHHGEGWPEVSRRMNHGIERFEHRSGNVGFVRVRMLPSPEFAGDTYLAMTQVLANSDAVILDLRNNGGGEVEMVQFLASRFLGAEPQLLSSIHWRTTGRTDEIWSQPPAEPSRLSELPLYILISQATGSAAEGLAASLQHLGRATVIGQNSYGAANPGGLFPAVQGFSVWVSYGRSEVGGVSWEGRGVTPDIITEAGAEIDVALQLAWAGILETSDDEDQRDEVNWALDRARALAVGRTPLADERAGLIGLYGDRRIAVQDGETVYIRGARAPATLVSDGSDTFQVREFEDFRLVFHRDANGQADSLDVIYSGGHVESNFREVDEP
jgi:hypothetical protein